MSFKPVNYLLFVAWLFITVISCSNNDTIEPDEDQIFKQKLQTIIDAKVGGDKLVGVSISIRQGNSERWLLTGGNSKDGLAISPDMRFGIGSITKTAVAATILKLEEEEGKQDVSILAHASDF